MVEVDAGDLPHLDRDGRPTLATVAALAGVHPSTASRALAPGTVGSGTRVGSAATVERIRRVATEIGFARNLHAAGLRGRRTSLAGVLVPRLTDLVLATIYEGIDEEARASGYQTFVANTRDDAGERTAKLDMLLARRVDGLVLGDARTDEDPVIARLQTLGTPFVLVSRRSGDHPSVTCDDYAGGRLAAEHLLGLGRRRLAVVAGEPYASTGLERTRGFLDACAAAGHPVAAHHVVPSRFDVAGGREAGARLLAQPDAALDGLFVVNDFAAIGALGALRAAGLEAGRDVALVGYNDVGLASELPLPLSSVRSPLHEMGATAMRLLLERVGGAEVSSVRLPPVMMARESSLGPEGPHA